jgi:hypothetical protein
MPSLFQEYELRRSIKTNPESVVGKTFCWKGEGRGGVFTVISITNPYSDEDYYIHYQYNYGGNVRSRERLSDILDHAAPYNIEED